MKYIILVLVSLLSVPVYAANVAVPVASDSRIKTFVYSENDVFNIVTHYGFESNIEFGSQEEIETVSIGNRAGFQIVNSGPRRLFIRPQLTNFRTNMTVITNKHAYQFDLVALPTPTSPSEELAYVVRFFYPGDKRNAPINYTDELRADARDDAVASDIPTGGLINNYNYTFTGSDALAPIKVYDDSAQTYFKFKSMAEAPRIAVLDISGKETAVSVRRSGEFWVVNTVASRFTIRRGTSLVCVYNEKKSS